MSYLTCPVCGENLDKNTDKTAYQCKNNHCFDIAKKGEVNLLLPNKKNSAIPGDSVESLKSRRAFLCKGYYSHLSDALNKCVLDYFTDSKTISIADCCCGEGYYTNRLVNFLQNNEKKVAGVAFDISKQGVKMASGKLSPLQFFVASVFSIPVKENSIDCAVHCFAPFCDDEIGKIVRKGGILLGVIPAKNHLYELKSVVYDEPYYNDEKGYDSKHFELIDKIYVKKNINLENNSDIKTLFEMTPYYYRTPKNFLERLYSLESFDTSAEFIIQVFRKI